MKIAVYHNLPPGGAKRILYEQIKFLFNKQHEIVLFEVDSHTNNYFNFNNYLTQKKQYKLKQGFSNFLPKRLHADFVVSYELYNLNKLIANYINFNNFDVVLVHTDKYIEAPFLLKLLEKPSLYFDQEILAIAYTEYMKLDKKVNILKRSYESVYRKARKLIDISNTRHATQIATLSKYMMRFIEDNYKQKSAVCYPGVYTDIFMKTSKNRNNIVLYMGNPTSRWCQFAEKSVNSLKSNYEVRLKILYSKNSGMKVNNDRMLSDSYSESIALLCTLPFEAFGLKAIESMACETPVLAVNEGGYRETVIDGVTGFLLPRDPKLFAEKIEWLMDNPDEARRMGKAGREHVKKNFTWEKHNKCIEKLLIETANAKK